jgi:hypothetical protein
MELKKKYAFILGILIWLLSFKAHAINNFLGCSNYNATLENMGITNLWSFSDTAGTAAADSIGANAGAYKSSPTKNQVGPLVQVSKGVLFNGSTQYVSTTTSISNPTNLTYIIWFKGSSGGGYLMGFGGSKTGASTNYDRQLYITDDGTVVVNAYSSTFAITYSGVSSLNGYLDGNWHMAAATISSTAGLTVYVDGVLAGTNSGTGVQNYSGYWRIGYDTLASDYNPPASNHFSGTLSNAAVAASTVLTTAQIQQIYALGKYCSATFVAPTAPAYTLTFLPSTISTTTYTCQAVAVNSNYAVSSTPLSVSLGATGGTVVYYSDANCTTSITSTSIPVASHSTTVYALSKTVGSVALTGTATSYTAANGTYTSTTNPYVWTGGGANALWTTVGNWSGGAVPGSSNTAVFTGTACSTNCSPTINTSANVNGIYVLPDYTGTITQGAGYTITTNNWIQGAGTFVGGNSAIYVNTFWLLAGGTFTSTTNSLYIGGGNSSTNLDILEVRPAATFNHNSGTMEVDITGMCWNYSTLNLHGSLSVYNFNYNGMTQSGSCASNAFLQTDNSGADNLIVNGTLTLTNGLLASGTYTAKGDVNITAGAWCNNYSIDSSGGGAYGTVIVAGKASGQTITGSSSGCVGNLTIAAGSNTVTLVGDVEIAGNYTNTSGNIVTTGSTIGFQQADQYGWSFTVVPGSTVYNNVSFSSYGGNISTNTDFGGATLTATGNITATGTASDLYFNNGTVAFGGNLTLSSSTTSNFYGTLNLQPTGNSLGQTISGLGTYWLPTVTIASGTHGVTLATAVEITTFGMTSGGFTMAGFAMTESSSTMSLGGKTLTKAGGVLKVNGSTVGTGALYGGTVAP